MIYAHETLYNTIYLCRNKSWKRDNARQIGLCDSITLVYDVIVLLLRR